MAGDLKQFVIYSRKSKFTGKGESIENQIEMCRQYIATHYSVEEAENALVYEDEGFSGGTLERPQFKKMMANAKSKKFFAIVVYRLDRISRNIGDFAKLIEQLEAMGISFVSIKEQFDTESPLGRAMMYICSVFSQLERETIAERIRDNMHELSKTGRWLGGVTPMGYESESVETVTIDGKRKKACKLKEIPEEIRVIELIFDKFLETGSLTAVDTFLLERGYVTRRGNSFTRFALKNILTNPVYMIADEEAYNYLTENNVDLFSDKCEFDGAHGIMAYNRTLQKQGKANQAKPMDEWIVSVGKHNGVISGEKWVMVQNRLDINKSKNVRKARSHVALLSGILYCGCCGDFMRPKVTNRVTKDGENIYTYLCTTKERSKGAVCDMKNPNGNILDAKIIEVLKNLGQDDSDFCDRLERGKKALLGKRKEFNAEIATVKESISDNEREIKELVSALAKAKGGVAEEYILKSIDELHAKGNALKVRLEELESLSAQHNLANVEFDIIRNMLCNFSATIDEMTLEQKRAAIRSFVRKVEWDGKNIHVHIFGSDGEFEEPQKIKDPFVKPGPRPGVYSGSGADSDCSVEANICNAIEPLCENSKRNPDVFSFVA